MRSSSGAGVTLASLATMGGELGSDRMSPVIESVAVSTRWQSLCGLGRRARSADAVAQSVATLRKDPALPPFAKWGAKSWWNRASAVAPPVRLQAGEFAE